MGWPGGQGPRRRVALKILRAAVCNQAGRGIRQAYPLPRVRMPSALQLPQPCAQSWDAMTPTAAGRYCAACQHEVVDFTTFTDGELAAYLARPGQLPCGRFRQSQLGRPLLPAAVPVAGWRRWLGAAAALLGLSALATPAQAQAPPAASQTHPATTPAPGAPLLGRMVRPRQVKSAPPQPTPATTSSVPMLLGEPVLAGAPLAVPVPAKTTKAKPTPKK